MAADDLEELGPGARLARFEIEARIGQGGMGTVFRARDPALDRSVAMKILRPEVMVGALHADEARGRLLREARALARVAHPHVVRVHEVGEAGQRVFLVMELVDGANLRQWLAAGTRTVAQIVAVLVEAGRGLAAAHAAGFVHRDFKPDNVLVGGDGHARVGDFGLVGVGAEPVDEAASAARPELDLALTHTGAIVGTPPYMAPEQFRGEAVDARADQFAFCITAWEALLGERPFAGTRYVELARNVCDGRIRPVPEGRQVPGPLLAVLRRGLAADPAARWPSVEALLAALAPAPAVVLPRRRSRGLLGGAIAATVALAVGVTLLVSSGTGRSRAAGTDAAIAPTPIEIQSRTPSPRPPGERGEVYPVAGGAPLELGDADVVDLDVTANGRMHFADAGRGGVLTGSDGGGTFHEMTGAALGAVFEPSVDASERQLVFRVDGSAPGLYLMNVRGTAPQRLTSDPRDRRPLWLADGRVAFSRPDGLGRPQIWLLSLTDRSLAPAPLPPRRTLAQLPAGGLLLVDDHAGRLSRWDPAASIETALALPAGIGTIRSAAASGDGAVLIADDVAVWKLPVTPGTAAELVWRLTAPFVRLDGVAVAKDGTVLIVAARL